MNSKDIKNLLFIKYKDDHLFIPECKSGKSDRGVKILDGIAIRKSYSNFNILGFEIKVSRSDFIKDNKMYSYLDYCNQLYLVCPTGLISVDEVPENIGLMYVSKGNKIFTKKKAKRREIDFPEDMFKYILFSRVKPVGSFDSRLTGEDNINYWKKWLTVKDESNLIGRSVSKKLREIVKKEIEEVRRNNKTLTLENEKLRDIKKFLDDNGIDCRYSFNAINRINDLRNLIPSEVMSMVRNLSLYLEKFKEKFDV